jgi:DNA repair ATPase RecN
MHVGNRLVGLGLAALGVSGVVACLAGIVGVWFAASRLQRVNSEVFGKFDQLIAQVDHRADQARDAVGDTRDLVDELKQTLRDSASDLIAERAASRPEIDNLEQRLASAMERADGLVELSTSTAELIEQLLLAVGDFASQRNLNLRDSSELMASVQSTRQSLANASEHLSNVQGRLAEIRQKRDVEGNLSEIMKLSLGIVAKLDVVQEQLAAFRGRLDERKIRLNQSQNRLRTWIFGGQCLILLLIAWAGAGQYCLLVYGWRMLRPPSVE